MCSCMPWKWKECRETPPSIPLGIAFLRCGMIDTREKRSGFRAVLTQQSRNNSRHNTYFLFLIDDDGNDAHTGIQRSDKTSCCFCPVTLCCTRRADVQHLQDLEHITNLFGGRATNYSKTTTHHEKRDENGRKVKKNQPLSCLSCFCCCSVSFGA
jgi:hypothetical protein